MSCAVERRAAGRSGAQFGAIAAGGRAARLQLPLAIGGHLVLLAVLLEDAPLAVALLHLLPLLRLLWLRVAAHVRKRPVLLRELRRVPVGRELLAADRAHHEPVHLAHRERRHARLLRAPRRRVMRPVDDALVLVRRRGLWRRRRAALADREGLGGHGNERLLRQELRCGAGDAHGEAAFTVLHHNLVSSSRRDGGLAPRHIHTSLATVYTLRCPRNRAIRSRRVVRAPTPLRTTA